MDKALKKTLISLVAGVLVFSLIYMYIYVKNNPSSKGNLSESWIETEAIVTGHEMIMNKGWLNIEYTDNHNTKHKTRIEFPDQEKKAEVIKILYNPENPKEIVLEPEANRSLPGK